MHAVVGQTGSAHRHHACMPAEARHQPHLLPSSSQHSSPHTPSTLCRWEVPEDIIPRPTAPTSPPESPLYTVTTGERDGTFRFELHRPDGTLLLNFTTLAFKDQFLYVDAHVPAEASLYGAGESSLTAGLKLPRNGKILTMWNLDIPAASADVDLYGSHPFFLAVMPDGRSHGVFLLNSNGMDMVFRPDSVSYR